MTRILQNIDTRLTIELPEFYEVLFRWCQHFIYDFHISFAANVIKFVIVHFKTVPMWYDALIINFEKIFFSESLLIFHH